MDCMAIKCYNSPVDIEELIWFGDLDENGFTVRQMACKSMGKWSYHSYASVLQKWENFEVLYEIDDSTARYIDSLAHAKDDIGAFTRCMERLRKSGLV